MSTNEPQALNVARSQFNVVILEVSVSESAIGYGYLVYYLAVLVVL